MKKINFIFFLIILFNTLLLNNITSGQEFPRRKIEILVPWAAGGGTDLTARLVADLSSKVFGVPFYVTNRTGGRGVVGFYSGARAKPDGYTVTTLTVEIVTISHLGLANVSHKDFTPIMLYNHDPAALSVRADSPYKNLKEFIEDAMRRPNKIKVGNSGTGNIWHLAAAGFEQKTGIELAHIPYNGAAPAIKAVLSGEIEATTASAVEVYPQAEGGKMRVLAIFGDKRLNFLPDVPTLKELGIDFTTESWRGLGVPKDTSKEIIDILHKGFKKVYESEEFQNFMKKRGFGVIYKAPEDFRIFMDEQFDESGKIIKNLGISNK